MASVGWTAIERLRAATSARAYELAPGDYVLIPARVSLAYPGLDYVQVRIQSPIHGGAHYCPIGKDIVIAVIEKAGEAE